MKKLKLKRPAKLTHRILSETGVIIVMCAVLSGIGYFISGFAGDFVADKEKLKQDIGSLQGQILTIQNKLSSMTTSLPEYRRLVGDKGVSVFELNRQDATRTLEELQPAYHLSNLRMSVTPTQELKDAQFHKTKVNAIESEITLNFDSVTDEYAMDFLRQASLALPGVSKITKITLTGSDFSAAILQTIASTGSAPLVKSDVTMKWRGMRVVKTPNAGPEGTPAAPGASTAAPAAPTAPAAPSASGAAAPDASSTNLPGAPPRNLPPLPQPGAR